MSSTNLINNLMNGIAFGMLTSRPMFGGCCMPMSSPLMSYPVGSFSVCGGYNPFGVSLFAPPVITPPVMPMMNFGYSNIGSRWNFSLPQINFANYTPPMNNWTMPKLNWTVPQMNLANYTPPSVCATSYNSVGDTFTRSDNSSVPTDNTKVTSLYKGTASDLNKTLANRGVLRGKGEKFMEMQQKYGISASFLAAICIQESGGTSRQARQLNNVCGIYSGSKPRHFSSVDDCIEYQAKLLKERYVDKGLVTISQIHQKYCPPTGDPKDKNGINKNWAYAVGNIKKGLDNNVA